MPFDLHKPKGRRGAQVHGEQSMTAVELCISIVFFVLMVSGFAFWLLLVGLWWWMKEQTKDVRKITLEPFERSYQKTKSARKMGAGGERSGRWDA